MHTRRTIAVALVAAAMLFGIAAGNLTNLTNQVSGTLAHGHGGTDVTSPGSSGNVLQSNGTNWTSAALATSSLSGSIACGQMPALTGDATSSAGSCATTIAANAVTASKSAVVLTRRPCSIIVGSDDAAAALADSNLGPQGRQCFVPFAATVVEITVAADAGTPNVIPRKNHAGSTSNLVSSALATASAGAIACSNTGGTTGLDGATTCSATLQNTSLAAGDWIELGSGTAGGTAKRMSVSITYTVN